MSLLLTEAREVMSLLLTEAGEAVSLLLTEAGEIMSLLLTEAGEVMSLLLTESGVIAINFQYYGTQSPLQRQLINSFIFPPPQKVTSRNKREGEVGMCACVKERQTKDSSDCAENYLQKKLGGKVIKKDCYTSFEVVFF